MYKEQWEGSYTQEVTDWLEAVHIPNAYARQSADLAISLLKQYHRDLHVPYEQRDEARARVKELAAANKYLLAELAKIQTWREDPPGACVCCGGLKPAAETQHKHQHFVACQHYPNALYNFFHEQKGCEFCCEKEPLKWFDNGKHRMPGK